MALIGHHFVERGLAWATRRLHAAPPRTPSLALRPTAGLSPDPTALARATAIYGGQVSLTQAEFISLEWLTCFAKSGRQLLLCHALRLLESWNRLRRSNIGIAAEADILATLVFAAGQSASLLPHDQHDILSATLQSQINRLLHLKTSDATLLRIKAMALLNAADVLQKSQSLQTEAMQILEQALPQLITTDGSPTQDNLPNFVGWLHPLLANPHRSFGTKLQSAVDRARPFLSMFVAANGSYCFDPTLQPLPEIGATTALRLASVSHVARLAAGKTIVITTPRPLDHATQLNLSGSGHVILDASLFLHGSLDDQTVTALDCDSNDEGQWFRQTSGKQQRTVFLCAKGDDIRVEDVITSKASPSWMRIDIADQAKVSIARNGTQATIALDGRNLWQLTLRGADLKPSAHGHQWLAKATDTRINWALKRLSRTTAKHGKAEAPDLPFELEIATHTR